MKSLPPTVKGILSVLWMSVNTLFWSMPIYVATLLRLIIPHRAWRAMCTRAAIWCAEAWIAGNSRVFATLQAQAWTVEGVDGLPAEAWYLVASNHVATADIFVLQAVFNRRIPFLKFFIKQELLWVPVIGLAWWALDFPFMKRYSKAYLQRHPEKKGKDLATTLKACEKFKYTPVSVLNFLEGTRITPGKYARQAPPFDHLLLPKAGGVAAVTTALRHQIHEILDVTLVYPQGGHLSAWDFLCGRTTRIIIHVDRRPIPPALAQGDYLEDPAARTAFQAWVTQLWHDKDALIGRLLAAENGRVPNR